MWHTPSLNEFYAIIETIAYNPEVQAMSHVKQHVDGVTRLDHSVFVAYLSFLICRKVGLDFEAAARAGLLHDLDPQDWRDSGELSLWQHLRRHPRTCMENAMSHGLSELEQDIILKHMWPMNLTSLPRHRESYVVNIADKICSTAEFFRFIKFMKAYKRLEAMIFEFLEQVPVPDAV